MRGTPSSVGTMRGVPLPDVEEDFAADGAELFFDLVFVFAFSRLVSYLVAHPDWAGVGEFMILFTMVWLPWSQLTWSANAVAGNTRPVRGLFLVATIASIPMAGSVTTAFDDGGLAFVISASVILTMGLLTMIVGFNDEPGLRGSIVRYAIPNWIAITVFVVGASLDRGPRIGLWLAAIAIVIIGLIRAGSSEWLIRPGHFAERHGLIVIVALGEVIVALGTPVAGGFEDGGGLRGQTLVALIAAGVFAGLLWWGYFDRPLPALEHQHEKLVGGVERGRYARDIYTCAHFPLVAGVILATAGLHAITSHPDVSVPTRFRWMLIGGLALYLLAIVVAIARAFGVFAVERLLAAVALVIVVVAFRDTQGVVLLLAVDAVLIVMLVAEHLRVERFHRPKKPKAVAR